jgi:hypothetical protein
MASDFVDAGTSFMASSIESISFRNISIDYFCFICGFQRSTPHP